MNSKPIYLLALTFFSLCLIFVNNGCKKENNVTEPPQDTVYTIFTGMVNATLAEMQSIPSIENLDTSLIPNFKSKLIPGSISLNVPTPGNQGNYKSCVAWAVGYGMLGYSFKNIEGRNDYNGSDRNFSPNYIWNQRNGGKNKSISITSALKLIKDEGCCKLTYMPLCEPDILPSSAAKTNASEFILTDYYRFATKDINLMKSYIFKGYSIVIGMEIDNSFQNMDGSQFEKQEDGRFVWKKYSDNFRGQHAMLICGYDDTINAFKVLNSKGGAWGNDGYIWIDYEFFKRSVSVIWDPFGVFYPEIYIGFIKRPIVVTSTTSEITANSATCGGNILSDWDIQVTESGVCWSTENDPTVANERMTTTTKIGNYSCLLTNLESNTKYYVKAYAINNTGISYGYEDIFMTLQNSILPNPEALWSFDDCTPNDFSGNNHHGRYYGNAPSCQPGIASNSSCFSNEALSYFDSPYYLPINNTAFSISFWVKFQPGTIFMPTEGTSFFNLETGLQNFSSLFFWNHYNSVNPNQSYWSVDTWEEDYGFVSLYSNTNYTGLTDGNWHHFALSCTNNTITLYMEGIVLSSFSSPSSTFHRISASPDRQKNACFDQIRFYNIALTSSQIQYIYNNHL